jgi:hypothetical protein
VTEEGTLNDGPHSWHRRQHKRFGPLPFMNIGSARRPDPVLYHESADTGKLLFIIGGEGDGHQCPIVPGFWLDTMKPVVEDVLVR